MQLIAELKRRKVFRVAAAYAVVAWGLAQVADLVLENTAAPPWVMQTILLVLAIGFPLAVLLAWAFEVTPDGVKRTESLGAGERLPSMAAPDYLLVIALVALVVVSGYQVMQVQRSGTPPGQVAVDHRQPSEGPSASAAVEASIEPVSIAVLAFENMSTDEANAYFADGISEEILNLLAGVEDLAVASRTSAFGFKGKDTPVPDIANALGVRYVLEGSVRKAGDRVRVTAQLIDAPVDRHLWSDTYDRTLDDIFAIQDEIAGAIGDALQIQLLGRTGETVQAEAIDPGVYARFLEARHLLRSRDPDAMRRANETLLEVVQREPEFARAHVVLGEAYLLNMNLVGSEPLVPDSVAVSQAELHAEIARDLDPELGGIDLILGSIAADRDQDLVAAMDHYARAIELEPNEPRPHHWRGMQFCKWGYLEQGLADLERGRTLEPENPNLHFAAADCLLSADRVDEARTLARRGAELRGMTAHGLVAIAALHSDDRAEAIAEFERLVDYGVSPDEIANRVDALESPDELVDIAEFTTRLGMEEVDVGLLLELRKYDALLDFLLDKETLPTATTGLWSARHAAFRQDPRFIGLAELHGAGDLWRLLGPPPDCRADGDSFTCGHGSSSPESDA